MDSQFWLPLLIILGFCIVFPIFWSGVVALIGLLSGWTALGRAYRARTPVRGDLAGTVRVGWARYNNVVRMDGGPEGLGLDVFVLFRPGHPPLRIPWDEVAVVGHGRHLFWSFVELRVGRAKVRLRVPEAAWARVDRRGSGTND